MSRSKTGSGRSRRMAALWAIAIGLSSGAITLGHVPSTLARGDTEATQSDRDDIPANASAHSFTFTAIEGHPLAMADYVGKAVLVVNTASFCGFTHQYGALQSLWETYRDRGLMVLAVPSNDFGRQEPGSNDQIKAFCDANFHVDFPMTEKQKVVGANAHPMFRWLSRAAVPRWNFHKFLIRPDGSLAGAFPSGVDPMSPRLRAAVEDVLPGGDRVTTH